jgi:hypothetical protein
MRAIWFLCLIGCAGSVGEAPKLLRSAIDDKQDTLDQCYAKNLKGDDSGKGDMELVLHVAAEDGRVQSVKIASSEIDDGKLKKCVTKALETVTIDPAPSSDFDIDYELQFGPDGGKGETKVKKTKPGKKSEGDDVPHDDSSDDSGDDKPAKKPKKPDKKPASDDDDDGG